MHGRSIGLAGAALLLALPSSAGATLGESAPSVQADQARMNGSLQVTPAAGYAVHEIRTGSGTVVREYVSPAGRVFGVAWEGRYRPDLRQLLGAYFQPTQQAMQEQRGRRPGRGPLHIEQQGLLADLGGHQRSFFGRAVLLALLPPGTSGDEVR